MDKFGLIVNSLPSVDKEEKKKNGITEIGHDRQTQLMSDVL